MDSKLLHSNPEVGENTGKLHFFKPSRERVVSLKKKDCNLNCILILFVNSALWSLLLKILKKSISEWVSIEPLDAVLTTVEIIVHCKQSFIPVEIQGKSSYIEQIEINSELMRH